MNLHIYNSYTRQKEKFEPAVPGRVGMYVCGPTVYGEPHLGHGRVYTVFDVMQRYFKHLGLQVRYVRNITDVGHLEDEVAGAGEDKISKKARLEQLEPMEIAHQYTYSFHQAMDALNNETPSIEPRATGHMIEQIEVIQNILDRGLAYEVNGSVYFDLKAYVDQYNYGQLSGKVVEDLMHHSRGTAGQDDKRHPLDFALWKRAEPEHIMRWHSPWGEGFPGWHLECTTMSHKYLGMPFDIHGGGMDLQFPHHEAEIAQAKAAFDTEPVKYWVHNNMLTINQQKMAKSLGNFITLKQLFSGDHEVLSQAYSPMTMRFFILQSHYRSTMDFSNEALQAAEKGLAKLLHAADLAQDLTHTPGTVSAETEQAAQQAIDQLYAFMDDDFNTARVLATLFEMAGTVNAMHNGQLQAGDLSAETFQQFVAEFRTWVRDILGLQEEATTDDGTDELLEVLVGKVIEQRLAARAKKDWATSDRLRDELAAVGIVLKDGKDGTTTWQRA